MKFHYSCCVVFLWILGCVSTSPQLDLSTLEDKNFALREINAIIPYSGDTIPPTPYQRAVGQEVFERILLELLISGMLADSLKQEFGITLDVSEFLTENNRKKVEINTGITGVDNQEISDKLAHTIFNWNIKSITDSYRLDMGSWYTQYYSTQKVGFSYTIIAVDKTIKITGIIVVDNPNSNKRPFTTPFSYEFALKETILE